MEMMTMEEFNALKKSINDAKEDDTPYVGVVNDEIIVNGDPNKTELIPHSYTIAFAFPKTDEWKEAIKAEGSIEIERETENYIVANKTYKNVWVTPRKAGNFIEAFTKILSFMNTVNEKGEIEEITEEQMAEILRYLNKDIEDIAYDALAKIIGIPAELAEFMRVDSVMFNLVKMAHDAPDLVNSSDLFFG